MKILIILKIFFTFNTILKFKSHWINISGTVILTRKVTSKGNRQYIAVNRCSELNTAANNRLIYFFFGIFTFQSRLPECLYHYQSVGRIPKLHIRGTSRSSVHRDVSMYKQGVVSNKHPIPRFSFWSSFVTLFSLRLCF